MVVEVLRTCARWTLDFALPPRCPGCGAIVDEVHSFCPDCWKRVELISWARVVKPSQLMR